MIQSNVEWIREHYKSQACVEGVDEASYQMPLQSRGEWRPPGLPCHASCNFLYSWDELSILANTVSDIYKCSSFFLQTIRDWKALPDSRISSAEGAKGSVVVLLNSPPWWELGTFLPCQGRREWLSFGYVTSKQFWLYLDVLFYFHLSCSFLTTLTHLCHTCVSPYIFQYSLDNPWS